MNTSRMLQAARLAAALASVSLLVATTSHAQPPAARGIDPDKAQVTAHWTQERRRAAQPRDLVLDSAGQPYLRRRDGSLVPYGRQLRAEDEARAAPLAAPSGVNDTTPPSISNMDPAAGAVIGSTYTFSATVTDDSGIRSVRFVIRYPDGVTTQSFQPSSGSDDRWSVTLSGFFDGTWSWWVEAKDTAKKGGNSQTSEVVAFSVATGGGGSSGSADTVTNDRWTGRGTVKTAAGRLYFEMPNNARRRGPWSGYVCSGSVVVDGESGRSTILTAAHCVYDDVNKAFARNVLFIPDQDGTSASRTDLNCSNDPIGCWVPSFGVVHRDWTTRTFPNNIAWDYGFYVVNDVGAHAPGMESADESLEGAAGALDLDFATPRFDEGTSADFTHALGYSYSHDPRLMYCAEDMTTNGAHNWWLPSCGLSGGSSGGPWMQPVQSGNGPVISVNSWGYTNSPGMAGPKLDTGSSSCVFGEATGVPFEEVVPAADGDAGHVSNCP